MVANLVNISLSCLQETGCSKHCRDGNGKKFHGVQMGVQTRTMGLPVKIGILSR